METKTFEHQTKSQKIHTYEETKIYPFAVLEETIAEEGKEQTTFTPILGNKRCDATTTFNDLQSCEEYIASKPYNLLLALCYQTFELMEYYKQQSKTQENENNE